MRDPLVAAHLDYLRQLGRSPRTIYQRRRSLAILEGFLAVPLAAAAREDLSRWRAAMRCGDEAVRHYVTDAHMFYRWLSETAAVRDDNPAEKSPVPRPGRRLPRPIGEDDLFRAVSAASGRVRLILVLAGWAGLRAKEIALLRRQYVLDSARPPYVFVARDATKGSAERIIPIGGFVLEELLAHGLPRAGSAYVLARGDGNPGPNAPHRISGLANDYLAGLGIDATLHQLRHRFATSIHQDSGDIRLVQELLGHSDLRTTQVYAAIDATRASAVVEALPAPRRLRACG